LGYDQYTSIQYGNDDLVLNMVDYMLDDIGLMQSRVRDVKLRLLNGDKIIKEANYWKILNVILPEIILGLSALILIVLRKRRYASH